MMKRIFVYEYLSGGGRIGPEGDAQAEAELLPLGLAMRDAMAADLLALDGLYSHLIGAQLRTSSRTQESRQPIGGDG